MRHYLTLLACLFSTFLQATTAVTENDPNAFVNGVNVITGDFYVVENDVTIQGAEPISLQRSYISQKGNGYWEMFTHLRAFLNESSQILEVSDSNGSKLFYEWDYKKVHGKKQEVFRLVDLNGQGKGISNTAKGTISGKTNLKNQKIHLYKNRDKFSITTPDGTKRVYESDAPFAVDEFMDQKNSSLKYYTKSYLLVREDLPNGNEIHYEWPRRKKDVWQIRSCDKSRNTTYAWARFYPKIGKHKRSYGDYGVETSDGRHFEYYFFSYNKVHQLKGVESDENPKQIYQYMDYEKKKLLKSIVLPENRFLNIAYYLPGDHNGISIDKNNPACFRVKELLAPVANGQEPIVTHKFLYDIPNKKTTVLDAYDNPTIYYWDDNLRLLQIDRFIAQGELYNRVKFIWGAENTQDASNLLCKVLFNEKEEPTSATRYIYDPFGNVLKEQFFGNLTGEGSPLKLDNQGFPLEYSSESYSKECSYSQDGKNLLLKREEDNGLSTTYTYLDNSPLISSEIHYDHNVPKKRKTYEYHGCLLCRETAEDLEGSTRLVKRILRQTKAPYQGLPSSIEERHGPAIPIKTLKDLFSQEPLLKRTEFSYGKGGRVTSQKIFDATNTFKYSLSYEYEKGCLISENNPLGYKAISHYDGLQNKIRHTDFGSKSVLHMSYDYSNRPLGYKESGEALERTYRASYNHLHQKVDSLDEYQNKTSYTYDPFGHLLTKQLPSGALTVSKYDASGNEISHTDAKGYETKSFYNAYDKPIQILYPDGFSEFFYYYSDGTLKTHIDLEGLATHFVYDVFGRVLSKKTFATEESWTYDSFNCLTKTDAEGYTTSYTYDEAGRKISETFEGEVTTYKYDSLGRLSKATSGDLTLVKEYNLLDQIIEEKKQDPQGNILELVSYSYEPNGLLQSKTIPIDGKTSTETFSYDAFQRIHEKKDPLGHITKYLYDDKIHQQTLIDPLGQKTIQTFNAEHKLIHTQKLSPQGNVLLSDLYEYDLNGNMSRTESLNSVTLREYGPMNRLLTLTEAASTSEEKITTYFYTPKGSLSKVILPGGVILTNTYNFLGHLEEQSSSDGSIHYTYEYNKNGLLLKSTDENTGLFFTRTYDPNGRLLKEVLPTELSLDSTYDVSGRRRSLTLPDSSSLLYNYDALHLKSVSRIKENTTLYTHNYLSYDLSGHLLKETSIAGSEPIIHNYDLLGRSISLYSPHFQQDLLNFDPVGNLLEENRQGESFTYCYDNLYQLISEKNHSYEYDAQFNRLGKDGDSFTANALNQTSELSYNPDGNPISWKGKTLSYDALNRLISVEDFDTKVLYSYDSLHRRLSKKIYLLEQNNWILSSEFYYLYDDQNEIGAFDGFKNLVELRVLGSTPTAEIGASVALELYGKTYIPLHDFQGNIATLIPFSDYSSSENYTYTAFGEEVSIFPSSLNPWRFASKRLDPETGFIYYGRRYYIPSMGRWLTPDPLGLEISPNLYGYLSNSPLTRIDLYGLMEEVNFFKPDSFNSNLSKYDNQITHENWEIKSSPEINTIRIRNAEPQILVINGIDTSHTTALGYTDKIREYAKGASTQLIYNPTFNKIVDPVRALAGILGLPRSPTEKIQHECVKFAHLYSNENNKIFLTCHSDGGTHVHYALESVPNYIRKRCIVLAIAPATIISKDLCSRSFNYASKRDFVTVGGWALNQASNPFRAMGQEGSDQRLAPPVARGSLNELSFLPPHPEAPFLDHGFESPTFKDSIKARISDYTEKRNR